MTTHGRLAAAVVLPHGGLAVERWCSPSERPLAAETRRACEEVARRVRAAEPEVVIVVTPHNVHVDGHMAVVTASRHAGALEDSNRPVELEAANDRAVATQVLNALHEADVPAVGVSFGSNDTELAEMPMDWGTLIPLLFLAGDDAEPPPTVLVSPARDLDVEAHVRAGRALAAAAIGSGRTVALVASADHGHAHDRDGSFGFDAAAAEYDRRVVDALRSGRLRDLEDVPVALADDAKADSLWQLLVLSGALAGGEGWRGELLSYEVPTYFGMACAVYLPLSTDSA